MLWKFLERFGTQAISFVVTIVIARLLSPSDYGVISLITVFISVSTVFVQSGLNTALIQHKKVNDADYSSVFYVSLAIAAVLYIILFFSAPAVADFYKMPQITAVLRVLALTLIPGAFNSIQVAMVSREMKFKKLFISNIGGIIISGIMGVSFAYMGFGTWALVAQQLSSSVTVCVIMFFTVRWRPKLCFSVKRIGSLFSFGWKMLISNLINTLYSELRTLIIGKKFSADTLGYYNKGYQFPQLLMLCVDGTLNSVLLPAYASSQENLEKLKNMMRRSIKTSTFLVFPAMTALAVMGKPLISLLLTDKWLPCVPFLQIFCFVFAFYPLHTANLQAIKAIGRSDIFLKLEIIKEIIGLAVLLVSVFCFDDVMAIAIGAALTAPIGIIINSFPNKKLLDYSLLNQLKDIMPAFLLSAVMGVLAYAVNYIALPSIIILVVQIVVCIIAYFGLAKLFKVECLQYIIDTLKEMRSLKNGKQG